MAAVNARKLAEEVASDLQSFLPLIGNVQKGTQRQGAEFGKHLVICVGDWTPILEPAIRAFVETDNANPNFLLGILDGMNSISAQRWVEYVNSIDAKHPLAKLYPMVITTGNISEANLSALLIFIDMGVVQLSDVSILGRGRVLNELAPRYVANFALELAKRSPLGVWYGLDVLAMYCYGDAERKRDARSALKELVLRVQLRESHALSSLGMHLWETTVDDILNGNWEPEFALGISELIVREALEDIHYSDRIHHVKPILVKLFSAYGDVVWPVFAEAIVRASPIQEHLLGDLLGGANDFNATAPAVIDSLPENLLYDWCKSAPERAPEFLARATCLLVQGQDGPELSARALHLIDAYGSDERVLSALSANFGTFGWTGSVVPYYERQRNAIEPLMNHPTAEVRAWAGRQVDYLSAVINRESERDEERDWGFH